MQLIPLLSVTATVGLCILCVTLNLRFKSILSQCAAWGMVPVHVALSSLFYLRAKMYRDL